MELLNPFPQLLTYSFSAPTLLRVMGACMFAYLAYTHYQRRGSVGMRRFPVLGDAPWVIWVAVGIETATALGLFFGYYTQYAAIAGAIVALKNIVWRGAYPGFFILPRSTALLLLAITLSLLLTGAGAFAFDIPL